VRTQGLLTKIATQRGESHGKRLQIWSLHRQKIKMHSGNVYSWAGHLFPQKLLDQLIPTWMLLCQQSLSDRVQSRSCTKCTDKRIENKGAQCYNIVEYTYSCDEKEVFLLVCFFRCSYLKIVLNDTLDLQ